MCKESAISIETSPARQNTLVVHEQESVGKMDRNKKKELQAGNIFRERSHVNKKNRTETNNQNPPP